MNSDEFTASRVKATGGHMDSPLSPRGSSSLPLVEFVHRYFAVK